MQNKCIRFCLKLDNLSHIGKNELEKINWLNTYDKFRQNLCTIVFNSLHGKCPLYISEIFDVVQQGNRNTRFSYLNKRRQTWDSILILVLASGLNYLVI